MPPIDQVLAGHKVVLFPDNGQYDTWRNKAMEMGLKCSANTEVDKWFEQGLIDKGDAIDDYYLNGLKTLNETVKIVDPEWNDWLKENQHLVGPMGLRRN